MTQKPFRLYVCCGPNCTPRGGPQLYRQIDSLLWELELDLRCELLSSGCQGRCELGPNLNVWPGPTRYCGVTPDLLRRLLTEHLRDGQVVPEYLAPATPTPASQSHDQQA